MHGPFLVGCPRNRLLGFGFDSFNGVGRVGLFRSFYRLWREIGCVFQGIVNCLVGNDQNRRGRRVGRSPRDRRDRLLPSRRRHLRVLVLVLGVTRGAACLLHVVFEHRNNRMVGDAALARTIVV